MSGNGVSKQKNRSCLICGESTRIAHLGIDACRACAVFYRRAKKGHKYTCRSRPELCDTHAEIRACKRCRFDRIIELLGESTSRPRASLSSEEISKPESPKTNSPSTSSKAGAADTPLLSRLHAEYKAMSFTQLSSELHARTDIPHPMQISIEHGPFFPVDFAALTVGNRILLTSSLRFGNEAFPKFNTLSEADKWKIVKRFMFPGRILECSYRTMKHFPDDQNKSFASYATYFVANSDTNFFGTAPQDGDTASAEKYLHSPQFLAIMPEIRAALTRVQPSYEEYLAMFLLTFWNIDGMDVSEEALSARNYYREAVLKELHFIYRKTLQIDDYAARLGELIMLREIFEKTELFHEHFEVFRLCKVVPDDNFVYALQREY
ncbi:hypothetical protein PRIPAC_78902 [Pristionchus pacificus]|uniref:Nuclear receptor n=1 Tax=Pristionchus pacificus TaxID=54126 RepID=A0A8R1Z4H1_PRIPA|nr:hypothetical protein PRIPAC_78902 [Pristionchus pacificus]